MVQRSRTEERFNAATHFVGALLALLGGIWMWAVASVPWHSASGIACLLYALLLMLMYLMSALSHCFADERQRNRFRALDQACILLLITGTYTPFSIHYFHSTAACLLLAAMWLISLGGCMAKIFWSHRIDRVSVSGYVALGWMPILGLPFHQRWPVEAMVWILVGGVVYSLGTILLLNDRKSRWLHPAWHLSVIVASAIHFVAVIRFVATGS